MAVDSRFLEDLKSRITLSNLIGSKVKLQKKGNRYLGLCPFHNEKTPSFNVVDDKEFFHCFGCGEHGDAMSFLMKTEGLTFMEAVSSLAGQAGMKMPVMTKEQVEFQEKKDSLYEVCESACQYFQKQLTSNVGKDALDYVNSRKISPEMMMEFRIGYADNGMGLINHLKQNGYSEDSIIEVGLARRGDNGLYAFFRDRLMFPIADVRGRVIAFGGRFMGDAKEKGVGKYVNSPDTPLFDKSRVLFNLKNARNGANKSGKMIVCEGYMDVIALTQFGFDYAVAPMGTALTEDQIMQVWKSVDTPILCFDGDEAGGKAAKRSAERIVPMLNAGKSATIAFMPDGLDPDDILKQQGTEKMNSILSGSMNLFDYLWQLGNSEIVVNSPESLAKLEKYFTDLAFSIENKTVQSNYLSAFKNAIWENHKKGRGGKSKSAKKVTPLGANVMAKVNMPTSQQKIVLAGFLNHPSIFYDLEEKFTNFFDENYNKLYSEICKLLIENELSASDLKDKLNNSGFTPILNEILNDSVYILAKSTMPNAETDKARETLTHIIDMATAKLQEVEMRENLEKALLSDDNDIGDIENEVRLNQATLYKESE